MKLLLLILYVAACIAAPFVMIPATIVGVLLYIVAKLFGAIPWWIWIPLIVIGVIAISNH